jgi:alkyl hydroperoxide reductase subunit AhpC
VQGKYYVIIFYPLDWTFVCPTEIVAFNDYVDRFRDLGCEVFAASIDSKHSHLAWIQTPKKTGGLGPMKYPILADVSKSLATSFGVLITEPSDPDCGVALRATVIVDDKGATASSRGGWLRTSLPTCSPAFLCRHRALPQRE